ncbi:MAG: DoxX family protein [Chitinophagales bacterium]|nr:DoxX family protein [Chitinophagales bacterium]
MTIWTINLYVFIAAIIITLFFAQIRKPKNYIIEIIKNFIGAYFIFSGVVKAIDPAGTGIKMEEYFEIFHQYFPFLNSLWDLLEPASLEFSIFTILLEIILGLFLLFGAFARWTVYLIFAIIVFFTFLTGFSHITGKVTDCGCFGDFIKLTPKVSFIKDVILMVVILPLVIYYKKITPLFPNVPRALALFMLSLLAIIFTLRNIYYEPIVDFRAYKVGVNIVECLSLPPDAKPYIYENKFIYKNNASGENQEFTADQLPTDWENWTFVDRIDKLIQKGDDPKCKDFAISDENGSDVTEVYMNEEEPIFVLILPNLKKTNDGNFEKIKRILDAARKDGYYDIALTGSNIEDVKTFLKKHDIQIDVFNSDETPLKTIMRSNPGLLILKKGTILGKYHHNDDITYKDIKEQLDLIQE